MYSAMSMPINYITIIQKIEGYYFPYEENTEKENFNKAKFMATWKLKQQIKDIKDMDFKSFYHHR